MKALLILLPALSVLASAQEKTPYDIGIKPEALRAMLPGLAARIEQHLKGKHPEADGLAERVEGILATQPHDPPQEDDKSQAIAQRMKLLTLSIGANVALGGIHGYLFDVSPTGHIQRYRDLEAITSTDVDEVRSWLAMRHAASALNWEDKKQMCHQRAIGAARALVSREPKNADAKALLAAALDWQDDSCPETLASIEAALKLEARHPLALELLHARHIDKLLETAAFRRPALPGEKLPGDINRQLYDHPLSAEELAAFQQQKAMLERETEVLLENAYQRRDTAAFLRLVDDSLQLRIKEASAQASHQRDPGHSFEEFLGHTMMAYTWAVFSLFEKPERLKQAVDLAGKDSEALGTIFILGVGVRAMNAMKSGRSLSIEDHEMEDVIMSRLAEIARADDSTNAARASEAIGIAGMFSVMSGRPPVHPDLFFRALQLDPFRHRALGLLLGGCMAVDPTAISAAAVMEMQLAVLPNLWTRRQCAAAAAKLHDWDTAFRHLDACAREKPGDLMVLNQRVATTLRQSQSKASIKKAALYYDGITADNLLEKTKDLSNDDRLEFIENFFLHLVLRRESEVAQTLLNQIAEAGILGEKAVKEWQELLR